MHFKRKHVFSLKFLQGFSRDLANVQAPARACFGRSSRRLPGAWTPSSQGSRCTTGGGCVMGKDT